VRPFLLALFSVLTLLAAACGDGGEDDAAREASPAAHDTRPATEAEIQALASIPIPGYVTEQTGATLLGAAATYHAAQKTAGGADLFVRANFAPCDGFVCASLDPKDYTAPAAQDGLKSVLPPAHRDNPALLWEFGQVQLSSGARGLFYYALSYLEGATTTGVSRSSVNTYRAWYHNGAVYVTLEVFARGTSSPLSRADVEKLMTRAEAERAARDVFAALEPQLPG